MTKKERLKMQVVEISLADALEIESAVQQRIHEYRLSMYAGYLAGSLEAKARKAAKKN